MTVLSFTLTPFPGAYPHEITLTGTIARTPQLLTIHYSLKGDLEQIHLPAPCPQPARREELWIATCFELFLALPGRPEYWEFNFSPSGDWNVFCMDAYRRIGFRPEERIPSLQLNTRNNMDCFFLEAALDLSPLFEPDTVIQAGITSVIQNRDGNETYWALAHPASQADFHWRESFILLLEGEDHPSSPSSQTGSRPARIHMP